MSIEDLYKFFKVKNQSTAGKPSVAKINVDNQSIFIACLRNICILSEFKIRGRI